MELPSFRYHADPIASGSIEKSEAVCRCCGQARGYVYALAPYAEADDLDNAICPWCIADGSAHRKFDATFVEAESLADLDPAIADEVSKRTPGYAAWQQEEWPVCCNDATAFLKPVGIAEVRTREHYQWEGMLMEHIVHNMGISGGAARRMLESLNRDKGPTAYAFECLHCAAIRFHIDQA
jgi:uncharacterized protein